MLHVIGPLECNAIMEWVKSSDKQQAKLCLILPIVRSSVTTGALLQVKNWWNLGRVKLEAFSHVTEVKL
jgi:hypothetical protein